MNLLMYIENDLIDAVPLERDKIVLPGYIGDYIRLLKEKHQMLIGQSPAPPEFLVHHLSVSAH